MTDDVVREVDIAAPVERVWELVTRPEHVRVWWAFDGATIDLRPGGAIVHHWNEHGTYRGVIEKVEPPYRLTYWYATAPDADPAPGRQTHVAIELWATAEGGTTVRVTETGFADLTMTDDEREAHIEATKDGWGGGLETLSDLARRQVA